MVKARNVNTLDDQIKKSHDMLDNILKQTPVDRELLLFAIEHGIYLDTQKSKKDYADWWIENNKSLRNQKLNVNQTDTFS